MQGRSERVRYDAGFLASPSGDRELIPVMKAAFRGLETPIRRVAEFHVLARSGSAV